jgi:hypothetical protein
MPDFSGLETLVQNKTKIKTKYFYHISPKSNLTELQPKNEEYNPDRKDYVKRVSLADTIHGCVQGIILPGWGSDFELFGSDKQRLKNIKFLNKQISQFSVYRINVSDIKKTAILERDNMKLEKIGIFDILLTGEIAYTENIKCEYIGKINVYKLTREECQKRWGKTKGLIPFQFSVFLPYNPEFAYTLYVYDFDISVIDPVNMNQAFIDEDRDKFKVRIKNALLEGHLILKRNIAIMNDLISDAIKHLP